MTDHEQIFDYIAADNPRAAATIDIHIENSVEKLAEFPFSGRVGRVEGTRELVIAGTPYIAAYRVMNDTIRILRVLHGSRHWPEEFSDTNR